MPIIVATFYHFFSFAHYVAERERILEKMRALSIKGSVLIAEEGINSTIAGTREAVEEFLHFLKTEIIRADFAHKESSCKTQPFKRAKVRLKKETISLGEPAPGGNAGIYVEPREWNTVLDEPETLVIDVRNHFEVEMGSFDNAIDPMMQNFKQLPTIARELLGEDKNQKIAAFCTGGIRCEKFTSWLKGQGFENVFHLKGGILKYLEDVPPEQSRFRGMCFVFDERVALDHDLRPKS